MLPVKIALADRVVETSHGVGIIDVLTQRKQLGIVVPRKQEDEFHVKEHADIGIVDYRFSNHGRQSVKCVIFLNRQKQEVGWICYGNCHSVSRSQHQIGRA